MFEDKKKASGVQLQVICKVHTRFCRFGFCF